MTLSICCITYNHEKFIEQAIQGFLLQQTNFDIEIVISDDCSTDSTQQICKEYETLYPRKFKLFLNKTNLGVVPNFIQALTACSGKYIALCEGDDYWIDPLKLQKQVDFLESNLEYSLCFHNAMLLKDNKLDGCYNNELKKTISLNDFVSFYGNKVPTATIVMRNNFSTAFYRLLQKKSIGDWYVQSHQIQKGNFFYINECLSVYRIHEAGVWSALQEKKKLFIFYKFYKDLLKWANKNSREKNNSAIIKNYLKNIMFDLFRIGNPGIKYLNKYYLLYVSYKYL